MWPRAIAWSGSEAGTLDRLDIEFRSPALNQETKPSQSSFKVEAQVSDKPCKSLDE
jgi:hypothetical protein